jgi:hypothetical protein
VRASLASGAPLRYCRALTATRSPDACIQMKGGHSNRAGSGLSGSV